mgnify:CR=1 FL=1
MTNDGGKESVVRVQIETHSNTKGIQGCLYMPIQIHEGPRPKVLSTQTQSSSTYCIGQVAEVQVKPKLCRGLGLFDQLNRKPT